MSMQINNIFKHELSIINRSEIFKEDYDHIEIISCKSINLPELNFINFLSETGDLKKKDILVKVNGKIKNNTDLFIDHDFENRFIKDYKQDISNRLLTIINSKIDDKISNIEDLFKCRYNNDKEVQFYVIKDSNSFCLKIILIDLFHLALPGPGKKIKGQAKPLQFDQSKIYNRHKSKDYCISKVLT